MATTTVSAIVVGGGIGGCAAAHALLHHGIDVRVYERAHRIAEVGAGVGLGGNGARVLERIGLGDAVRAAGAEFGGARLLRCDGTPLSTPAGSPDDSGSLAGADTFGRVRGMHRADLLALLLDSLPAGVVTTGRRAVAVTPDTSLDTAEGTGRAGVRFDDGSSDEADLIVGADGIHSVIAPHVVTAPPATFSGIVAYRGLVPTEQVAAWPTGRVLLWLGHGRTFIAYPVRCGSLINFVGLVPADERMSESWSAPGDPDRLRAEFAGWDPTLGELLARVEQTFRWGLYDRDPLPHWTRGRVTLLGDAAHPMLPFMGQGANQAIEDGAALAALLDGVDTAEIPDALTAYQHLRLPRTTAIQRQSRATGALLAATPTDPETVTRREHDLQHGMTSTSWVTDYDIDTEAQGTRTARRP